MILGWEKVERPWKFRTTRCHSLLEFVVLNSYVMPLNHKHFCHASALQSVVAHIQDLIKFAIGFIYSWFYIWDGIYDMGLVSEPHEQLEGYLTSRLYQCHVSVTRRTIFKTASDWSRCVCEATLASCTCLFHSMSQATHVFHEYQTLLTSQKFIPKPSRTIPWMAIVCTIRGVTWRRKFECLLVPVSHLTSANLDNESWTLSCMDLERSCIFLTKYM